MDMTEFAFLSDSELQERIVDFKKLLYALGQESESLKMSYKKDNLTYYRMALHLYYGFQNGLSSETVPTKETPYSTNEITFYFDEYGNQQIRVKKGKGAFWKNQAMLVTGKYSQEGGKNLYKQYRIINKLRGPDLNIGSLQSVNRKIADQEYVLGTLEVGKQGYVDCEKHLELLRQKRQTIQQKYK